MPDLPKIPMPKIPMPSIPVPKVTLPTVPLPDVSLPDVSLPSIPVPDVNVPLLVSRADKALNRALIGRKESKGTLRPPSIVPYMGWYAGGVAHLKARIIETPEFPEAAEGIPLSETFRQTVRRFTALAMPEIKVKATIAGQTAHFLSDADGYVDVSMEIGDVSPGWHVMDLSARAGKKKIRATGRVLAPDPAAGVAVISDIDDTILKTGLTQGWTAARRTFFRDVSGRRPVKGMPEFYRGLERGVGRQSKTSFFYVSTGSWNMYHYLVRFLELRDIPIGPLFLTDWGPTSTRLMRDGREHKRQTIRTLISAYPDLKFVMIGDVGQGDPETYELMMREFPDQVIAAMLIYVGSHLAERTEGVALRSIQLQEEEGMPYYYLTSSIDGVSLAWQMGLVDASTASDLAVALDGPGR